MQHTTITEKAQNIYNAIRAASIVKIASDNVTLTSLGTAPFIGHADNEVFRFKWQVPWSVVGFSAVITEEGLEEAFIDRANPDELILIDSAGDEVAISLYHKVSVTHLAKE
jgi:hypothetical protein